MRTPSPDFNFPSLPPSPPPDSYKFSPTKMEMRRSKEKQEKFEKINETRRSTRKSPVIQHVTRSNIREDSDTMKRRRPAPDEKVTESQKISPEKVRRDQGGKPARKEHGKQVEPLKSERKSRRQREEEAWIPQTRKSRSATPTREERQRGERREKDDICPKCHHKKGRIRSKSSDQHLKASSKGERILYLEVSKFSFLCNIQLRPVGVCRMTIEIEKNWKS